MSTNGIDCISSPLLAPHRCFVPSLESVESLFSTAKEPGLFAYPDRHAKWLEKDLKHAVGIAVWITQKQSCKFQACLSSPCVLLFFRPLSRASLLLPAPAQNMRAVLISCPYASKPAAFFKFLPPAKKGDLQGKFGPSLAACVSLNGGLSW